MGNLWNRRFWWFRNHRSTNLFPTPADYELGIVTLTLTASRNPLNCNSSTEDTITLNFIEKPTVDAGPSIVSLCEGALAPSSYVTNQATAIDYSTLTWSSHGTGTWSTANPNNLLETYTPSAADYDTGFVILTLRSQLKCALYRFGNRYDST